MFLETFVVVRWSGVATKIRKLRQELEQFSFRAWWQKTLQATAKRHPLLQNEAEKADIGRSDSESGQAVKARWVSAIRAVMESRFADRFTPEEVKLHRQWSKMASLASSHLQGLVMPAVTRARTRYDNSVSQSPPPPLMIRKIYNGGSHPT